MRALGFLVVASAENQVHISYSHGVVAAEDWEDSSSALVEVEPYEQAAICREVVGKLPRQLVFGVGVALADGVVRGVVGSLMPIPLLLSFCFQKGSWQCLMDFTLVSQVGLGAFGYGFYEGLTRSSAIYNSLAYGWKRPKCCCDRAKKFGSIDWRTCRPTPGECGEELEQVKGGCSMVEFIDFDKITVRGCNCQAPEDCGTNPMWDGHAWCFVNGPGKCGKTSAIGLGGRWDFCRVSGDDIKASYGIREFKGVRNDALAAFIPNEKAVYQHYVDSVHGFAFNPKTGRCFVALVVDTLSECAETCLHGDATFLAAGLNSTLQRSPAGPCAAFAFDHRNRRCVLLPPERATQRFEPVTTNMHHPDGWQNFALKFNNTVGMVWFSAAQACSRDQLVAIRARGNKIIRDKNNGHLYVQTKCGSKQKVSCRSEECLGARW
eukprot:CAMPEP_0204365816 /NCGR_PEP_ID=MMETSP0469-20131031/42200_1 /ASSEMBLY_ACC=CAM_ASM_000384 /TAXON_ID=2969 /ORGANISM="Oxyrrhis marina" /LENGTH=434 /DNA_ID=CAMNT_0051354921 /DNA_START=17 /DNA_END=1318 /DNA_ORIENTATION=+